MKKKLRDEWVAALRSGKYSQGKRSLRNLDHFCCLGILCDISGESVWEPQHRDSTLFSYLNNGLYLPPMIRLKSGLSDAEENRLACMNDDGNTFTEIADYIEQNIPVTE